MFPPPGTQPHNDLEDSDFCQDFPVKLSGLPWKKKKATSALGTKQTRGTARSTHLESNYFAPVSGNVVTNHANSQFSSFTAFHLFHSFIIQHKYWLKYGSPGPLSNLGEGIWQRI